jgi:hypothetical protein
VHKVVKLGYCMALCVQSATVHPIVDVHRFVDNQLANKKTSKVLEAAFGSDWTDAYMHSMMFDFCPDEEPRVLGAGDLVRLYSYFDDNPELGTRPAEMQETIVS